MTAYYAYLEQGGDCRLSSEGRDKAAEILGTISPASKPIADAEEFETLKIKALAFLGHEPKSVLYLTDANNRVYEILINRKYHTAVEQGWNNLAAAISLLALCLTTLLFGLVNDTPALNVACFGVVSVCYVCLVKTEFLNEIEAAILCEILLILALILAPIIILAHRTH